MALDFQPIAQQMLVNAFDGTAKTTAQIYVQLGKQLERNGRSEDIDTMLRLSNQIEDMVKHQVSEDDIAPWRKRLKQYETLD
jgi:hypothetical protein